MSAIAIRRIARIGLTVADLDASVGFFGSAMGFREVARERRAGRHFSEAVGLASAVADVVIMRLGSQEIELTSFLPPGRRYPAERRADDPWFQHFAIVVSDMAAAYAMLGGHAGWTAISTGGPQLLPPETGGIVAFKFRDPDGHPLELSCFPPAVAGAWNDVRSDTPFLGLDHSALGVLNSNESKAFYVDQLDFRPTGFQVNEGPAQDRLDGLPGVAVEITSLGTAEPGPHIELLGYRHHESAVADVAANDIASTRLILERGGPGSGCSIRDPNGHLLEVRALGSC